MQASGRCATQQTWRQWNEIRLLTFAVLLLRGARLGDILGQPNLFTIGLAVFSSAALLSRHAGDGAMLPSVAAVVLGDLTGGRGWSYHPMSALTDSDPHQWSRTLAIGPKSGSSPTHIRRRKTCLGS